MIFKTNFFIEKPKATIIISHGIGEHSGSYERLAKELNAEGYDCITFDHLGHGRSGGPRGKIKSFHQNIDNLHNIVEEERVRSNNKIYLLGHSMGGGIVNLYGAKYGNVDGIISLAAATKTPKSARVLKYIGFWYLRWVRINLNIFDNDLAKDPAVLASYEFDDLRLKYMYVSLIGEMFVKGVKYLDKNASNYTVPVIFLHGTDDKIVDVSASVEFYDKVASNDKELKLYEGEYHEMLNDYNRDIMIKDILEWLEKRV